MFRLVCLTALLTVLQASATVIADDQSDLDDVLKRFTAAFKNHDAEGLSQFYARKTDVIHGDDIPRKTRKEMRDAFAAFFKENPNVKTSYTEIERTTLAPKIVVESGLWHDTGLAEGKSEKGRYTAIFKKINGTWLTIYERGWKTPDPDPTGSK